MSVLSEQPVTVLFSTANPTTGAAQNADDLPTVTLYVNGTASSAIVTVTNITTGIYAAAVTLPELEPGDVVTLCAQASVDGISATSVIWQDACETAAQPGDAMTLTPEYDAAKTSAQPGDEMSLTSAALASTSAAVWDRLTSLLSAAGSIGEFIRTRLSLLGTGQATVAVPVASTGNVTTIEGDDYRAEDGRALEWMIPTTVDMTGGTVAIIIHCVAAFVGTISMVDDTTAFVQLELTREQTESLGSRPAKWPYSIVGTQSEDLGGDTVTLLRGWWTHIARHRAPTT